MKRNYLTFVLDVSVFDEDVITTSGWGDDAHKNVEDLYVDRN